jgi:hypothetical protein
LVVTEVISASGHINVRSTNRTTFEITKDRHLTRRGDCVIVVGATKAAVDLNAKFKDAARSEHARMMITIEADGEVEVVNAWGNAQLSFTHLTDLVVRKSDYICGRTLAIRADKAAKDLSRKLIEKIRDPNQKVEITLTIESVT